MNAIPLAAVIPVVVLALGFVVFCLVDMIRCPTARLPDCPTARLSVRTHLSFGPPSRSGTYLDRTDTMLRMTILWLLCIPAGAMGVINLIQAFTGRQVVHPEKSRRAPEQIRRESLLAAIEMFAIVVALVALALTVWWLVLVALLVATGAIGTIFVGRQQRT